MTKSMWWVFVLAIGLVGCEKKKEPPARAAAPVPAAATPPAAKAVPTSAPAPAPTPPPPAAPEIAYYFTREVTAADLDGKTLRELNILRNTIYARAGNSFRKSWLRDHFTKQPWYKARKRMDESVVTLLDRQNALTIARFEAALKRPELKQRKKALLERVQKSGGNATEDDGVELGLLTSRLGPSENNPSWHKPTLLEDPSRLDKLLSVHDLDDLSRRDLRILRNMIFARRGREFKSEILQEYFSTMAWYRPDPSFTAERITELDKKNVRIIRSVEVGLGGMLTDNQHGRQDQRDEKEREKDRDNAFMHQA